MNNPNVVLGFVVGEPQNGLLHWVYTKDRGLFRRAKVATRLVASMFGEVDRITATVSTPEFKLFMPGARIDPYALTERVR